MFGPFPDPSTAVEIGRIFGDAGEHIRQKRERSDKRASFGERARLETSDTDDLVDDFEVGIRESIERVSDRLSQAGPRVQIEFHSMNLQQGEENRYGADIGVRLHIAAAGFNISKAVLFQCKRMYRNRQSVSYDRLRGDGERQAEAMLSVTPASFFLLFNSEPPATVRNWMIPPVCLSAPELPAGILPFWFLLQKGIEPASSLWDPGITVLPATRIFAESRVYQRNGTPLPVDAEHWTRASVPIGVFMADLFGSCFVGDVRTSVLRRVLPPHLRDLSAMGIDDEDASMLPVRRLMDIRVTQPSG